MAFSPNAKLMASGSKDRTVKLWDVSTGHLVRTLSDPLAVSVESVAISPDGKKLAAGWERGEVQLWDLASGNILRTIFAHSDQVKSLSFSSDGKWLASGSSDKAVKL
ncbi:hypothetical protein HYR54_00170 [Candidatus Acetothermia bacterium]|nr:hypothetical protein [Candidatus Acetothermia bacterium]